ncbi:MAG: hypothetical protein K0Q68_3023 [Moraxellaceae bacterium]|jgi:uncharacterized protein YjfI (DUF2170 family)|nr:hypothetical protein [Moraxellaceae bacterium]
MDTLQQQITGLEALVSARLGGVAVETRPIPGAVPVVQVTVEGREELPIYVTCAEPQILCIVYLWGEDEVKAGQGAELLGTLLDLNVSIPLSSFGRIGGRYVLFGALARNADVHDIAEDVAVLSDNSLDALEAFSEFLN